MPRPDDVLRRWEQADKVVERVQQLITEAGTRPNDLVLRREIGLLLLKYYSREMGEQYLRNVLLRDPEDAVARTALADYYTWRGWSDQARGLRRDASGSPAVSRESPQASDSPAAGDGSQ
jgi:hypothetical protein